MPDYSKCVIYTIKTPNGLYVGSTCNFVNRKYQHKIAIHNENAKTYNRLLYKNIRENNDEWDMKPHCEFPCENKTQMTIEEERVRRELNADLNMCSCYNTEQDIVENKKQYYQDNKDYILEHQKQYHKDNREKILERQKQYEKKNKEQISERKKQYYQDNKEKYSENYKQYYQDNKEQISERKKQYYQDNKEKYSEYRKKKKEEKQQNINMELAD